MNIEAVIFDLNGTIVSDEDEWGVAFRTVLSKLGVKVESDFPHVSGIGVEENWPIFIKKYGIKTDKSIDELGVETKKEYFRQLPKIKLKKGLKTFLKDLRISGIKTALATSSTWEGSEKVIDKFGLLQYFDSITTGEEAERKKPDPELFETAARKLGVSPQSCLVFEDSVAGVDAAHEAGMTVVAIYRNEEHKKDLENADYLIRNFEEVSPGLIASI